MEFFQAYSKSKEGRQGGSEVELVFLKFCRVSKLKKLILALLVSVLLVAGLSTAFFASGSNGSWRTASRESAGIAPKPDETEDAVIQVYGASTWGWRGIFAIHTWISTKRAGDDSYTVYEVIGWRLRRGESVVRIAEDIPDRYWYGERPELLTEKIGDGVDRIIDKIELAARSYPWPDQYKAFPGPNSNTFTAWVAREVPELDLDLPFSAIGSGFVD